MLKRPNWRALLHHPANQRSLIYFREHDAVLKYHFKSKLPGGVEGNPQEADGLICKLCSITTAVFIAGLFDSKPPLVIAELTHPPVGRVPLYTKVAPLNVELQ